MSTASTAAPVWHTQTFSAPWPQVLEDMQEYIALTHLSIGRGRRGQVRITLSRQRVQPDQLRPAVDQFRRAVAAQCAVLQLSLHAADHPEHRVQIHYPVPGTQPATGSMPTAPKGPA